MRLDQLTSQRSAFSNLAQKAKEAVEQLHQPPKEDQLRPAKLDEFIGQRKAVRQLHLTLESARLRGAMPDHILIPGPGGLGKTTLALMIANEMHAPLVATTAPTLKQEPLTRMLSGMEKGTVLFVDEIHRMSKTTEELLYSAMEDGVIDCNTPMGFERRKVQPFTLVGATTLPGKMSESFKDRFGVTVRLEFYDVPSLVKVVHRSAGVLGTIITPEAAEEIAVRARGIPRVANALLRRLRDYAEVHSEGGITASVASEAFKMFDIDELGLERLDREVLTALVMRFRGGPIGLSNLATTVGEDEGTIADDVEPYLVRLGLVARTPRGRVATEDGRQHVADILSMGEAA